jgi:hypothetical protein
VVVAVARRHRAGLDHDRFQRRARADDLPPFRAVAGDGGKVLPCEQLDPGPVGNLVRVAPTDTSGPAGWFTGSAGGVDSDARPSTGPALRARRGRFRRRVV